MRGLKKLEELHFAITPNRDRITSNTINEVNGVMDWVYSWCAQCLPQLKLIGDNFKHNKVFDNVTPNFSRTSCLETLHTTSFLPEASLPNLKTCFSSRTLRTPTFSPKSRSTEI